MHPVDRKETAVGSFAPPTLARAHAPARLDFLDGLRGLAALYVAVGHACVSVRGQLNLGLFPPVGRALLKATDLGHYAVALFIVLSGYCLMLPVARSADGSLRNGVREYLKRRARRILPPYYAALIGSLIIVLSFRFFPAGRHGEDLNGLLSLGSMLSHLLLLHNLSPLWVQQINGPMWSVALEWQIYFVFPALLLPVWRRSGVSACLALAFFLGLAPHFLLPQSHNFDWTYPWYVGLFSLGMVGALISYSGKASLVAFRRKVPWGPVAFFFTIGLVAMLGLRLRWAWNHLWLSDPIVGLAATCVIIYCAVQTSESDNKPRNIALKFLSARWIVGLGVFSYSLYLVHMPLLHLTGQILQGSSFGSGTRLSLQMGVFLPIIVLLAYLFHLAFERPYMSGQVAKDTDRAKGATFSPAPGYGSRRFSVPNKTR